MCTLRIHLRVYGRVQGVGFRYACYREANALGLRGWVRNRSDESVEIVAEGDASAVQAFREWCDQGPAYADVDRVDVDEEPAAGDLGSFDIRD